VALVIICIVAVALAGPTSPMRWIGLTIVQGILVTTFSIFALSRTYVQLRKNYPRFPLTLHSDAVNHALQIYLDQEPCIGVYFS